MFGFDKWSIFECISEIDSLSRFIASADDVGWDRHRWPVTLGQFHFGRGTLRHGWMDTIHKLLCWLLVQAYVLPFSLRDTKVAMEAVECHEDLMEAKFQACHPTSNTRIAIQNQEFSTNSTSWHFMIMILHASSQRCLEDLHKSWKFLLIPVPFPFVPTSAPSTVGWGELDAPECVLERWGSHLQRFYGKSCREDSLRDRHYQTNDYLTRGIWYIYTDIEWENQRPWNHNFRDFMLSHHLHLRENTMKAPFSQMTLWLGLAIAHCSTHDFHLGMACHPGQTNRLHVSMSHVDIIGQTHIGAPTGGLLLLFRKMWFMIHQNLIQNTIKSFSHVLYLQHRIQRFPRAADPLLILSFTLLCILYQSINHLHKQWMCHKPEFDHYI